LHRREFSGAEHLSLSCLPVKDFALRLLGAANHVLSTRQPRVEVPTPDKEMLLSIRNGKLSQQELESLVQQHKQQFDTFKQSTKLAKKTDRKEVSDWLVQIRKASFATV
jgi:hypothetical protein